MELIELRERVDCRTVLQHGGWRLDVGESTPREMKYRRSPGEIIIVTHDGKEFVDPLAEGVRGDVIALAERLWGCSLGHAHEALRPLVGIAPFLLPVPMEQPKAVPSLLETWSRMRFPKPGSPVWLYLNERRALPPALLKLAMEHGLVREGIRGTALFQHAIRGQVSGWEIRGPTVKGFLGGGTKGLFVLSGAARPSRIVVCESAIEALSLAAIEALSVRSAYVSTGGGWGDVGRGEIEWFVSRAQMLVAAGDCGIGGEVLAARLTCLAEDAGVKFVRLRPAAEDWNDQLRSFPQPPIATESGGDMLP